MKHLWDSPFGLLTVTGGLLGLTLPFGKIATQGGIPAMLWAFVISCGAGGVLFLTLALRRQFFKLTGQPLRHKVISRSVAYHGTTMGALSITGIPAARQDFEPLVPGAIKVANTNF